MEARRVALLAIVAAVPVCEFDVAGTICLNGGQQARAATSFIVRTCEKNGARTAV